MSQPYGKETAYETTCSYSLSCPILNMDIDDNDDIVDLTDDRSSSRGRNSHHCDELANIDSALQNDKELQALLLQKGRAHCLVQDCSLALSQARAELHRCETRVSARTKALVDAAEGKLDWVGREFPFDEKVATALRDVFKISSFRPLQREAINALLSKRDVLGVLPTGAGKSLIYQLTAVVAGGVTLVVSPLLALMHEQKMSMRQLGISAFSLDAKTPKPEAAEIWSKCLPPASQKQDPGAMLIFVTPERVVKSKKLMNRLQIAYDRKPCALSQIVLDEAHSISTLGHE